MKPNCLQLGCAVHGTEYKQIKCRSDGCGVFHKVQIQRFVHPDCLFILSN